MTGFDRVSVVDTRTAEGHIVGEVDPLYTPGGREPIAPHWLRATYDVGSGAVVEVLVYGGRLEGPRTGETLRRAVDYDPAIAPAWLHEFVEAHRPPLLPKIPANRRFACGPAFTASLTGSGWSVIGPAEVLRVGAVVEVATKDGDPSWVQVLEHVAERTVRHRTDTGMCTRYVMAEFAGLRDE